jgi:hypothetical protein
MALGAERERVLRLVLRDGLRPALTGLLIGMAASAGVTRLSRSLFYATSPLDATVFASVIVTLLLSSTAACILPAWRAPHRSIQYRPFGLNRCGHHMTWDANLFDSVLPINWRPRQQWVLQFHRNLHLRQVRRGFCIFESVFDSFHFPIEKQVTGDLGICIVRNCSIPNRARSGGLAR